LIVVDVDLKAGVRGVEIEFSEKYVQSCGNTRSGFVRKYVGEKKRKNR
jgi:hypothetical protein